MIEKAGASVATVAFAIERASARTGVDFDYLMKTALRESSLNPSAKAGTSSATGLFQFIDQTWLGMVKEHGAEHGLGHYADQISQTKSGRYVVADRQIRREILALRYDAEISATMAAEYTQDSADMLRGTLGREPTGGELYAAHFLGPGGALDLIKAAKAPEEIIEELYIRALTRKPKPDELKAILALLGPGEKPDAQFYKDVFSSLLNSSEFMFNH